MLTYELEICFITIIKNPSPDPDGQLLYKSQDGTVPIHMARRLRSPAASLMGQRARLIGGLGDTATCADSCFPFMPDETVNFFSILLFGVEETISRDTLTRNCSEESG